MGLMSYLRNRAGVIIVGVIGFAIFAFLFSDAVRLGSPFWRASQNEVGVVAGEAISIQDFNSKVEVNANNFKQQMGQGNLSPQMMSYVVENTWNQTVSQILMDKEMKRLGLQIGKNEMNDLITGKNPDPQVIQNFGDPKTGQLNRMQLNAFLENIKAQDPNSPISQQWTQFLLSIRENHLAQKYNNLVKNSLYVTSLEAREDYDQRNKLADFRYVNLDYSSIPDNQVKLTDQDYQNYYNEHKYRFKNEEESRTFEYVVFDAKPSHADTAEVKAQVTKLAADFRATNNDSLFVSINSDSKVPVTYVRKGQLDPALDSLVFNASAGSMVGPVFSNGAYHMAKVLDIKVGPDSVTASHILINPATEGGMDKAKAKADSIINLIRKGAKFADLAAKYGTDASKDQGGELGTFGRGAMVPAFEEAVFNGKPGDLKTVTTQFGVHVVKIDAQKGSSRVAKVAVVDKALNSSNKTQQEAYTKASTFLSQVKNGQDFDTEAKKLGVQMALGENVVASQSSLAGLDNPREIIRWAYKTNAGEVADQVFEMENKYVVAKMISIAEKGTLPLDQVKKHIEPAVRNMVKAKMLNDKMQKALSGATSIEQLAQKLGQAVMPAENVVFANPVIPGIAQENKVVGAVFGSQPGKLSKVIEGNQGVYAFVVDRFSNPAPLTNVFKQKTQVSQGLIQRAPSETYRVLKDNAQIKDNRVRFF